MKDSLHILPKGAWQIQKLTFVEEVPFLTVGLGYEYFI